MKGSQSSQHTVLGYLCKATDKRVAILEGRFSYLQRRGRATPLPGSCPDTAASQWRMEWGGRLFSLGLQHPGIALAETACHQPSSHPEQNRDFEELTHSYIKGVVVALLLNNKLIIFIQLVNWLSVYLLANYPYLV